MDVRRLLVLLLVGLTLPVCAGATTYKLPVTTATLTFDARGLWSAGGEPLGDYTFEVDPPVLRACAQPLGSDWWMVSYSMVVLDWRELDVIPDGTLGRMDLCLTSISSASSGQWSYLSLDHIVPHVPDFVNIGGLDSWEFDVGRAGATIIPLTFGSYYPLYSHSATDPGWAIPLFGVNGVLEIAGSNNGLGLEAPYILVTTVPETPPLLVVAVGLLSLCGLRVAMKGRRGVLAASLAAFMLLASSVGFCGDRSLPSGFTILPSFPRLWWSFGCAPTTGAMICGYYDNSGFPRMARYASGDSEGTGLVFPTTGYPNDNYMFLRRDQDGTLLDPVDMYVSRCALSATEEGVFGQVGPGHVDDYYDGSNLVQLGHPLGVLYYPFPVQSGSDPYFPGTPHADNCIADYMGTSQNHYRSQYDGFCNFSFMSTGNPAGNWGYPYRWHPTRAYPAPRSSYSTIVDSNWGLAQYISQNAGYYCKYTSWLDTVDVPNQTYGYNDVADFYNLSIAGYRPPGSGYGATYQNIIDEINAGRPVMAVMHTLNTAGVETTGGHVFPVFGYRPITDNGQPNIDLLVYDTWNEDCLNPPQSSTSYRIVKFPNASEIPYKTDGSAATGYFTRASDSLRFKLFGFCFLRINNNARCPDPLQSSQYPSNTAADPHTDTLNVSFGLDDNSRVHFTLDGKDPTPNSPYVKLVDGTGTLHIDHNCNLKLRTYRDADVSMPQDGYLASKVIERTYWVSAPKSNLRAHADGDGIITGPMVVTRGTSETVHYCYVEDQDRLSGIRVQVSDTAAVSEGDLVSVYGALSTNSEGERFVDRATVTALRTTTPITPLGMPNRTLGGGDLNYNPTTGAGQQGVTNGAGLNNIGLLVKTTGCVSSHSTSSFEITDGSPRPITVITPSGVTPPQSGYVGVTGVCSRRSDGSSGYKPVLLVRTSGDIDSYGTCETSGGGSNSQPEQPVIQATDTVAWALGQVDGTSVSVKACSVLDSSASGLTISDGWGSSVTLLVPGNWAVDEWSTVDVTGILTTLASGTRAITASQILVYTDSRGRPFTFPIPWRRGPAGQLIDDWPYKQAASSRSM